MKKIALNAKVKFESLGSKLNKNLKKKLKLLQDNINKFAKQSKEIKGVDYNIIEHYLEVNLETKLVRQKSKNC